MDYRKIKHAITLAALTAIIATSPNVMAGTTAADRAGDLKLWRERCNDPDPDLRLAYIEEAIVAKDSPAQRICIKTALESDNHEIRNLGLRAAIAITPQITFTVGMPPALAAALESVNHDEKAIKQTKAFQVYEYWTRLQGGLVFMIEGAKANSPSSVWYSMTSQSSKSDSRKGNAVVTGNRLVWVGTSGLSAMSSCTLNVILGSGGELKGTFQISDEPPFPIVATLP